MRLPSGNSQYFFRRSPAGTSPLVSWESAQFPSNLLHMDKMLNVCFPICQNKASQREGGSCPRCRVTWWGEGYGKYHEILVWEARSRKAKFLLPWTRIPTKTTPPLRSLPTLLPSVPLLTCAKKNVQQQTLTMLYSVQKALSYITSFNFITSLWDRQVKSHCSLEFTDEWN